MNDRQPSIADYAFISNGTSMALVGRDGAVDWCCLPRADAASTFGRLLDAERGGTFTIESTATGEASRSYLDDTLVLVTTLHAGGAEARIIDFISTELRDGFADPLLVRIVEGVRSNMEMRVHLSPRFDYAELKPWMRRHERSTFSAVGGNDALVIRSDADLEISGLHDLEGVFVVREGARRRFALRWVRPETVSDAVARDLPDPDRALDETVRWWRAWAQRPRSSPYAEQSTIRSAIVLKGLMNDSTGAVLAAATTSLPEAMGEERNWDYRFSWIRDSQFAVSSLGELGCTDEADAFRRFIERSAAGSAESLQIMYGAGGERRLTELELGLAGFAGSRPVRVGNAASNQLQLDVYGYLLELAWQWHNRGRSPDDDYWRFLTGVVDLAAERWREPDCGIWEVRTEPAHFVHSKVMCWVALDRGVRLAGECLRAAPVARWRRERDACAEAIENEGVDHDRGVFVRSFGSADSDASLLLLPAFGYVAYDDDRMRRTVDVVRKELEVDGMVLRYRSPDGLGGAEGAFVACTFWLAECLARQGRLDEAEPVFDRAMSAANDLGLFSEEYEPAQQELLGNFPQALSHLAHISAAIALATESEAR